MALVEIHAGEFAHIPTMGIFGLGQDGCLLDGSLILSSAKVPKEVSEDFFAVNWHSLVYPLFFAISLMHCKNVVVDEVRPLASLNRDRGRAGLGPLVRYHTIHVDPAGASVRGPRITEEGVEPVRAMHICRGHFSTYTAERPLFGRVAGTFWIPSHVRGSIERGMVASDYKVHGFD